MKKNLHPKLNNAGATLIMVIISLAFIAVLGSIVVAATIKNIEMKAVDRKSKENFYSAEAALDEIKVGLTETVAQGMSEAYIIVLKRYSTSNKVMREALFQAEFIKSMKDKLQVSISDNTISTIILSNYLKETKKNDSSSNGAELVSTPTLDVTSAAGEAIIIKNLKVTYTLDEYTSSIFTDIKIILPKVVFDTVSGYVENTPFKEYALIADEALLVEQKSTKITGSVYAGKSGILVNNSENNLEISGGRIISLGNISVKDKAKLSIHGINSMIAEVWATNLITTQLDKTVNSTIATTLEITANSYVKDDLILDAKKSNVVLKGEYYGYSDGDVVEGNSADNNSAIMINATDATLMLDELNKLYLAGRAFVSLNSAGIEVDSAHGAEADVKSSIMTGESLALKGSQNAYLLPETFIAVGHNPVSWDEYITFYKSAGIFNIPGGMINIPVDSVVFNDPSILAEESKLLYYLNDITPVKKAFYKFGADSNVLYYYLNFKSDKLATTYFKNYKICYPQRIYNGFPIEDIVVNKSIGAVATAGNLLTFDDNLQVTDGNNGDYTNNYASQFENLTKTLQKNVTGPPGTTTLFYNLINVAKIKTDVANKGGQPLETDENGYYVNIMDNKNTYIFNKPEKKGIIIATGNVNVLCDFTGLIISGGQIQLMSEGVKINADPTLVTTILNKYSDVKSYFTEFNTIPDNEAQAQTLNIPDLIIYENWEKY